MSLRYLRQKKDNKCGPIAIANTLRHLGHKVWYSDLDEIAELCQYCPKGGTPREHISKTLKAYNVEFVKRYNIVLRTVDNALANNCILLAVSYLKEGKDYHSYLIVDKLEDGRYLAVNLYYGEETTKISSAELSEILKAGKGSDAWVVSTQQ